MYKWRTKMQLSDQELEDIYQQWIASGAEHGEVPKREIKWGNVLGMTALACSGFAVVYGFGRAAQWLWKVL